MTQMTEFFHELINRLEKVPVLSDMEKAHEMLHSAKRILFIGNGGSAAIASHMAIDWQKNGGVPSLAFNDAAALTCTANDYGYDEVFSRQLTAHATSDDVLVSISSSGQSPNIVWATGLLRSKVKSVITLSGFDEDNPLRKMGDINLWFQSHDYGVVEIASLACLHAMVAP